jgi:hypothetical protein
MAVLNQILRHLFDALLYPLRELPPFVSLAILSLILAVAILLVYRKTSDQARITHAKRQIQAGFFEIRLFNDDPRAILRAQNGILLNNLVYLRTSLVPLFWLIVPLTLIIAHLQPFYGYRSFRAGESFLVLLKLQETAAGAAATRPTAQLRVPPGLVAETPAVWIPSRSELVWRLRAERPGRYALQAEVDGRDFAKDLSVAAPFARLSPVRQTSSLEGQLQYPGEPPLPGSSPVHSIRVGYPSRDYSVFGWRLPWLAVFFGLVTAFALLLKGRLRVSM